MGDEIRAASRDCPRVVPASAVPDQSHAGAVLPRHRFDPAVDTLDSLIRTADIGDETAHVGPISDPVQPRGHHHERLVAGEEPRNQDHRTPTAA